MAAFRGGQNPLSQMDTLREVYANLSHQPPSEAAGDDALGGAAAPFSLGSLGDDFGDAMAAARAADGGLVAPPGEDLGGDLLEAAQRLDGDETRARAASARARGRASPSFPSQARRPTTATSRWPSSTSACARRRPRSSRPSWSSSPTRSTRPRR